MLDIFFYEAFDKEEELLKKYLPANIKAGFTKETIQEYGEDTPPAKIISLRTQSKIPDNWINNVSGLLARATGFNYLTKYANQVPCGYLPLYCHRAVAEQSMLLWMSLLRKLPNQTKQFNQFNRDGITGLECAGKKVLIVGVGNIGYEAYKIAKGLEMKSFGVDIEQKYPDVEYVSIEQGIELADIVVCAMNLTEENKNYFKYDLFKKSKPGLIFVNISRGELSPTKDLIKLLEEKHLGGVALDVYENEPAIAEGLRTNTSNSATEEILNLAKKDNVILTPHNAFNTYESTDRKSSQSIEQVKYFLEHEKFLWEVPKSIKN